ASAPPARSSRRLRPTSSFSDRLRSSHLPPQRINVLDIRTHSSKFWPRGRMRRAAHVVVKRRGGGRDQKAGSDAVCARKRKRVTAGGLSDTEHRHASVLFSYHQRARKPGQSKRNGLAGQCHGASGGGGAGERAQTRQS